jgi:hypothetical protein
MIYVKERSEVTAVQYNGKNGAEIDQAFGSCRRNSSGDLWLGEYLLRIGDWAIRDCGITYTMSDSVFQKVFVPDELDWADRLTKIEELERCNMRLSEQLDEVHKAFPSHDEDSDHLPTVIERHIGERIDAAVKEAIADTLRQAQAELRSLVAGRSVQEIVLLMMASEKIGMIGRKDDVPNDCR